MEEIEIWPKATGILDLPDNWPEMAQQEMRKLEKLWADRLNNARLVGAIDKFSQEFRREWAIETGVIENLYEIDRGVTNTLIEKGFTAAVMVDGTVNKDPEEILALIRDQKDALDGLFDFVNQNRPLSIGYIRELHSAMTRSQTSVKTTDKLGNLVEIPMVHGDWKAMPNYPQRGERVFTYCPPEHTQSEMERLIAMHLQHVDLHVPPEIEAAWLHHRFTQIHPFQDGNGRVARALATLVLVRARVFPMMVSRDEKDGYIRRLEQADASDILPFIRFISLLEQRAYRRAVTLTSRVMPDPEEPEEAARELAIALSNNSKERENRQIRRINLLGQGAAEVFVGEFSKLSRGLLNASPLLGSFALARLNGPTINATQVLESKWGAPLSKYFDVQEGVLSMSQQLKLSIVAFAPREDFMDEIVCAAIVGSKDLVILEPFPFTWSELDGESVPKKRLSEWSRAVIGSLFNFIRRTLEG